MAKKCDLIKRLNDKLVEKHGVPGRITSLDEYKSVLYKLGKAHAEVFNKKTTLSIEETIKQYPEITFINSFYDEENRTYYQGLKHRDFVFFKTVTIQNDGNASMSYNFKSFEAFKALIGDNFEFNHIFHYLVTNRHLPVVQKLYKEVTGRELKNKDSNKILDVRIQKEFEDIAKKVLKELKSERINAGTNLDFNMRYTGKNRVVKLFFDFLHYLFKKAREIRELFKRRNDEVPPLAKVVALMYMHRLTMDDNSVVRKVFSVNRMKPGQDLSVTIKELEKLLDVIDKKSYDIPVLIQIPVVHPSLYADLFDEIKNDYPELDKKIHDSSNIKFEMLLLPIHERNANLFSSRNTDFDLVTWLARELIYGDDELFNALKDYFEKNDIDSYLTRFLEYYTRRLGLQEKENLGITVEEVASLEEAMFNVIMNRSLLDSEEEEETMGISQLIDEVIARVYGLDANRLEVYAKRLAKNNDEETVRELAKMLLYRYLLRTPDGRLDRDFLDAVLSYAEIYGNLEDALFAAIINKTIASGNLANYAYSSGLNTSKGYVMGEVDIEDKPEHVVNVVGEFLDDNLRVDVDKMSEVTGESKENILNGKTIEMTFGNYTYVFKRHAGTDLMKVFWYDHVGNTRIIPGTMFEMSGVPDSGVQVRVSFDTTSDRIIIEGDKVKDIPMHLKTAEYAGLATFRHELMHVNELLLEALDSDALKGVYLSLVKTYNSDKLFRSIVDSMLAYNNYSTRVNFLTEGIANMMFNEYTAHILKSLISQHFNITFDTPEDLFKQLTDKVKVAEEPNTDIFIMKHFKEEILFSNPNIARIVYTSEEKENLEEPIDFMYGVSTHNGMISILTDDNYTYHDNSVNAEVSSLMYLLKSLFSISTKVTQIHRLRFKPTEAEVYALEGVSIRYFHARKLIYNLDPTASITFNDRGVTILLNNAFITLSHRQFLSDDLIKELRRHLPSEQYMRLEELYDTSLSEEELRYFEDLHAMLEGSIQEVEEDKRRDCRHI